MSWEKHLLADLRKDEGLRLKPYRDSVGVLTVGYGHTKNVSSEPITLEQAEQMLQADAKQAIEDAKAVVKGFNSLCAPRKTVVANMVFNLGIEGLSKFKNTLHSISIGDYCAAALHMLDSKWAAQTGQRARYLANRMSTGKY